ncbi:MAG: SLBB domain-containing protein [Chloroflexi bacterium]|nr:SLBB domain-containing protein [Chloroflexota bacterium]
MEPILLTRDAGAGPEGLEAYRADGGYAALTRARASGAQSVLDAVAAAGLRGRGGAGFPVGRKWALAASAPDTPRYVVANGGEDEPGSAKDQLLLERYPHKVIEGVALAACAVGAEEAVFYVNALFDRAIAQLEEAIAEASAAGLFGGQAGGSGPALRLRVHAGPPEYVAGEDTAALEVIEGRKALPREKPPFPTSAGLHGKPTVVNNVETFACVPAIVRNGPEWFRGIGAPDNPGTMLFTLPANLRRPGVVELPTGTTLRTLLDEHGGGLASGKRVRAVLPGGPSSGWLGADDLDVPLDREPLAAKGSALGCGVLRVLEEDECVVEALDDIAGFFMRESCGQCPACVMGTQTLAKIVTQVRSGQATQQLVDQIPRLAAYTQGKGLCSLISMPFPSLTSAIRLFPGDIAHHIAHGACPDAAS